MANLTGARFILRARNLLWNMKYESSKLLRQAWRVQYCDGELAVRVFHSCSNASSRSLPEEENVEKGDRWILYLEICLNPECCSCSAQPLAEWSSGCVRVIKWWCGSVLGRSQCLLTLHGQPNLTRPGTDGGTLWFVFTLYNMWSGSFCYLHPLFTGSNLFTFVRTSTFVCIVSMLFTFNKVVLRVSFCHTVAAAHTPPRAGCIWRVNTKRCFDCITM